MFLSYSSNSDEKKIDYGVQLAFKVLKNQFQFVLEHMMHMGWLLAKRTKIIDVPQLLVNEFKSSDNSVKNTQQFNPINVLLVIW